MKSELLAFAKPACVLFSAAIVLAACMAPPPPPPAPTFSYTPPPTTPVKSPVAVAILKPVPNGKFMVRGAAGSTARESAANASAAGRMSLYAQEMFTAAQNDIEKMLVAKGFATSGRYGNFEEMTYSQKERSTIILNLAFNVDVDPPKGAGLREDVQARGQVTLEFLEPLSREKVWFKKLNLPPITTQQSVTFSNDLKYVSGSFSEESWNKMLVDYYNAAMPTIWNAFDAREIAALKKDADTIKGKTQFRGGR